MRKPFSIVLLFLSIFSLNGTAFAMESGIDLEEPSGMDIEQVETRPHIISFEGKKILLTDKQFNAMETLVHLKENFGPSFDPSQELENFTNQYSYATSTNIKTILDLIDNFDPNNLQLIKNKIDIIKNNQQLLSIFKLASYLDIPWQILALLGQKMINNYLNLVKEYKETSQYLTPQPGYDPIQQAFNETIGEQGHYNAIIGLAKKWYLTFRNKLLPEKINIGGFSIQDLLNHGWQPTFTGRRLIGNNRTVFIYNFENYLINNLDGLQNIPEMKNRLIDLNLSHNLINTIDPNTFSGLQFDILNLSHNQISTIAPGAFNNLQGEYLSIINLEYNNLTSLPNKMLDGLSVNSLLLDLSHNELKIIDPNFLEGLKSNFKTVYPVKLNLMNNKITYVKPAIISKIVSYSPCSLNLSGNYLSEQNVKELQELANKKKKNVIIGIQKKRPLEQKQPEKPKKQKLRESESMEEE